MNLRDRLNHFGYDLQTNDLTGYTTDRRKPSFGIVDRRTGHIVTTYPTSRQIAQWCDRHFGHWQGGDSA